MENELEKSIRRATRNLLELGLRINTNCPEELDRTHAIGLTTQVWLMIVGAILTEIRHVSRAALPADSIADICSKLADAGRFINISVTPDALQEASNE